MAGIFPESADGGIPPNAADPSNPKAAYLPAVAPVNTAALYYGNGCDVRLRPEVVNSLISEMEATVDQAGVAYDITRRENMEIAIRYLIQRGQPYSGQLTGGPASYTLLLDPPATYYSPYFTVVVVPDVTNSGPAVINISSLGDRVILRNDGQPLVAGDLQPGVPVFLTFFSTYFSLISPVKSQQPPVIYYGGVATGGPNTYAVTIDPIVTAVYNHLSIVIVPAVNNQGAAMLNVNNLGPLPLARNDGQPLQGQDLRAGIPAIVSYWNGVWVLVGLASSQVPIVATGSVDIWIRTDGNDATGDGSANTAGKAFATLLGAWNKVGARYAATPLFTMRFRFGMPGTYAGAILGPFGGQVELVGDSANRGSYRLSSIDCGNNMWANIWATNISINLVGLTFQRDVAEPLGAACLMVDQSTVSLENCDFDSTVPNKGGTFMLLRAGATVGCAAGTFNFNGRSLTLESVMYVAGGSWQGCQELGGAVFRFNDIVMPVGGIYMVNTLGVIQWIGSISTVIATNVTGVAYWCTTNSILSYGGTPQMGTLVGQTTTGGQVIP
jgi:hypothetical protein